MLSLDYNFNTKNNKNKNYVYDDKMASPDP